MNRWGEKRYHSLDYDLKQNYGEKVYKITLDGGMTCPNRDGKVGRGGCIFCSASGSGDFAGSRALSITEQIARGKKELNGKRPVHSYIAYFQAFTNTYAPVERLKKLYMEAIQDEEVKILSIATRPDCLGDDVLELLGAVNRIKPVWVELGLQTIHPATAAFIRRGYELPVFEKAVKDLRKLGITVIVHTILFLPGETKAQMLKTLDYLNHMDIQGIKLQLLHILKGTDLAEEYKKRPFLVPDMQEYIEFLGTCISRLNPQITIHRLTGDGPSDLLIAPLWTSQKRTVLNTLHRYLKEQDIWQGKEYHE
ncbi:MAG: TIGR01212 family radical SAM protein [Faecalicatena sp.]|uniref:TIGR01212 family radical SAM protein n=1 Tax=Faecalicatena sp. TaxID=2005360 RepID=UPI0025890D22|nr:TIGR01212 family radical SAM protein [Faecalicatena sp.]MCI6466096.1 TIGR01212 family radical SAM protein [Faecalicatena sp.]MDY4670430.1 TIGR01212 family radical SAM protein [Oliverpabstia sp.]MDY5621126.1 TIGR01212 family radical SAM protein [Lachnospiraceae bacterium]